MAMLDNVINKDTAIKGLISLNGDAASGYDVAADACGDEALALRLRRLAEERRSFCTELGEAAGEEADAEKAGTVFGPIHRVWIDARSKLNGGDRRVVIAEVDRGDAALEQAYQQVAERFEDPRLTEVLQKHAGRVRDARKEMQALAG